MMKRGAQKKKRLDGREGFTLLEVMASVAILGLAIVMLIQVFSGALVLARSTGEHTDMALLAKEKLSEAAFKTSLREGVERGTEGALAWEVATVTHEKFLSPSGGEVVIYKVTVSVKTEGNKGYGLTTLKTVIK